MLRPQGQNAKVTTIICQPNETRRLMNIKETFKHADFNNVVSNKGLLRKLE